MYKIPIQDNSLLIIQNMLKTNTKIKFQDHNVMCFTHILKEQPHNMKAVLFFNTWVKDNMSWSWNFIFVFAINVYTLKLSRNLNAYKKYWKAEWKKTHRRAYIRRICRRMHQKRVSKTPKNIQCRLGKCLDLGKNKIDGWALFCSCKFEHKNAQNIAYKNTRALALF